MTTENLQEPAPDRRDKYDRRMKELGLKRTSVYAHPDDAKAVRQFAKKLRDQRQACKPAEDDSWL